MKRRICAGICALFCATTAIHAQRQEVTQLGILEERVSRLTAQVEDLQFRQERLQKEIESIREQLQQVRRSAGGVDESELRALENRIAAVDAARQADKKAIIEQLAKELANIGKPATPATGAKEYVVQKGDTLTTIARANGVTVPELKKANGLTGDDIRVGQKLVIPK